MAKYEEDNIRRYLYSHQCHLQLCTDFRTLYSNDIRSIFRFNDENYTKTYKMLEAVIRRFETSGVTVQDTDLNSKEIKKIKVSLTNDRGEKWVHGVQWMRVARPPSVQVYLKGKLLEEYNAMKEGKNEETENNITILKKMDEENQGIECACCFGEFAFDGLAQCSDGHLVCVECLKSYTCEQIYGSVKFELSCMADECSATYLRSEMERCLPKNVIEKWDERVQEENLRISNLDLTRCPYCHYAGILSPGSRIFQCQRETCLKLTCKDCGEDWYDEHVGKLCSEIEKKDETSLRKLYEEKMSKAMVRTCPKCNANFVKGEGCNRMSCHCGMTMCYICRKPDINYHHFCTHPHSPGKGCRVCKMCFLWADSKQDEERAIAKLEEESKKRRKSLCLKKENKLTGPPPVKVLKVQLEQMM